MGVSERVKKSKSKPWRSLPADLSDEEWGLIADLVPTCSGGGRMGRPAKRSKREVVNAILYVAATGCQWRALPLNYPHWNTVHRYRLTWSRDGTWERIVDRLRGVGTRTGRPRSGAVGVGYRRWKRSRGFHCWGFYQGIRRRQEDIGA